MLSQFSSLKAFVKHFSNLMNLELMHQRLCNAHSKIFSILLPYMIVSMHLHRSKLSIDF